MMEPRKYRNPPIEEAVCDLQFAPGVEWDPTLPGRIYGGLKGAYGEKPRLQQLVEAQLQGDIEGQSSISMQQKVGKQRVQFLGEGGTRIVGVGADQLSVHMLRPYTGWESFRPQIHQALDAYYPGSKEGHIPTRSASEGSGAFPSLAHRVNMQQHAELPCRGNTAASPSRRESLVSGCGISTRSPSRLPTMTSLPISPLHPNFQKSIQPPAYSPSSIGRWLRSRIGLFASW